MKSALGLSVLAPLMVVSFLAADVTSGPAAGEKVPPLKVFDATGMHKDKEVDYAALRKEQPTVYLFVQQFNRPTARFMKALDGTVQKDFPGAYVVAVWLADTVDKSKEYLPRLQEAVKFDATALTVIPGDKNGPEGWGLNDMAHVTVVVANKGKVAASIAIVSVNETDARPVRAALEKAVKGM
jgi:hypothetical protein